MMLMKDLKWMLSTVPDEALVTIDGNYNVNIEKIHYEVGSDCVCDLRLTEGYSVTKDSIIKGMFDCLRR